MKPDFYKFTRIYGWGWKITGIFFAALILAVIICGFAGMDVNYSALPVLFIIGLLTLIPAWRQKKFRDSLKDIEDDVLADFAEAVSFGGGSLRMGKRRIYMKGKSRLVDYADIAQVYQRVTKTYFIETERTLTYVDTNGRKRSMCRLELRGKSDEEVKRICINILMHNPNVKIGYR